MVLQIAHQVGADGLLLHAAAVICRSASLPKNADGPLPHSTSLPFPTPLAGSCLFDRRAMPPLTRIRLQTVKGEETARENSANSVDSV